MQVSVVGAGIVGMSAALYLQKDGHKVTVYDANEPGSGASYGNAGSISTSMSLPTVTSRILKRLPKMLLDPYGPLQLRARYLPALAPWLIRLALATRRDKIVSSTHALGKLLDHAEDSYQPLIRISSAHDLVSSPGRLLIYSTAAAYDGAAAGRAEWDRRSFDYEKLDANQVREIETSLKGRIFQFGTYFRKTSHVSNPQALVQRFVSAFVANGGNIVKRHVRAIGKREGRRCVVTDTGERATDTVVIAAGAWSKALCRSVGVNVPLESERGYHLMFPAVSPELKRSVLWADKYVHLVPIAGGVRLTSGVELASNDAPADFRRIYKLAELARQLMPALAVEPTSKWLGLRPSLPDSLPIMGRAPAHRDVILCFGHQHLGLTMGPISGRIIADIVSEREPPVDITPFRVDRSFF